MRRKMWKETKKIHIESNFQKNNVSTCLILRVGLIHYWDKLSNLIEETGRIILWYSVDKFSNFSSFFSITKSYKKLQLWKQMANGKGIDDDWNIVKNNGMCNFIDKTRGRYLEDHTSYVFSIEAKGCLSSSASLLTACFRAPRVSVTVSEYSFRPLVALVFSIFIRFYPLICPRNMQLFRRKKKISTHLPDHACQTSWK